MNLFEHHAEQTLTWIQTHQERFWTIVGGMVLTAVFFVFLIHQHDIKQDQAWMQLGEIHGHLMQSKLEDTGKELAQWQTQFSNSSASSYAKFMGGDLLMKTPDYTAAAQVYGELAATAKPADLRPLALAAQASAYELGKQWPQAQAAARAFIDKYPDHYFAGDVYLTQARAFEQSGDFAGARAVYERFVILYPQHPSIPLIRKKLGTK